MDWLELAAGSSFLLAGLAVVYRWLGKKGDRWAAAFVAVATALGIVALSSPRLRRPVVAVIILDQPLPAGGASDLDRLIRRLAAKGAHRLALLVVDPTSPQSIIPELRWVEVEGPGTLDRLGSQAVRVSSLSEATSSALDALRPKGWLNACADVVVGTVGRVVVGVSDPQTWRHWQPLDVDDLLPDAGRREVVVDRVDLRPRPIAAAVAVEAPLGLPADYSLHDSPVSLIVTLRAPGLLDFASNEIEVDATGRLEGQRATLSSWKSRETVRSTGEIVFEVPLSRFLTPDGRDMSFAPGFVRCDLDVKLRPGGRDIRGRGTAYLPVRQAGAVIVCGEGRGASRLLTPSILERETTIPASEVARIAARATALLTDRARSAARFEFIRQDEFLTRLADRNHRPFFVVLHECAPSFWTTATIKRLDEAVRDGVRLVVVDPPPLPTTDPALAGRIADLLPAVAAGDNRMTTPTPHTADRLAILNLVFDYGRAGDLKETPGKEGARRPLPPSIEVQKKAADALLDRLRAQGLVCGRLEADSGGELIYKKNSHDMDHVLVRIAPRLKASDPLVATLFGSLIELRVASLFAGQMPGLIPEPASGRDDETGVRPPPATPEYPSGDPMYTPRQALVLFTGNVPQAGPGDFSAPIHFTFGSGAARVAKAPPRDITARLLIRGVTTAVIRLDVPDYDAGLDDLTRNWPVAETNPLTSFGPRPEQILQGTLARLGTLGVDSWLTASQARARLLARPANALFFDRIELSQGNPLQKAKATGEALGEELVLLLGSPRATMALAVVEHGREVDGRAGPGLLASSLAPGRPLPTSWNPHDRWAAPDRFRWLVPSPGWADEARANCVVAVDVGREAARLDPQPMIVAGVRGPSAVICMAYSPFETSESWRDLQDRICTSGPHAAKADQFGPQRLIDPVVFAVRLRPSPIDQPLVRSVVEPDGRGGCELVVDFRPDQAAAPGFWQPTLTVRGSNPPGVENLELRSVAWSDRSVKFGLSPQAAARLCGSLAGVEVEPFLAGRPDDRHRFFLPKPPDLDWLELSALESVDMLASYSGGTLGGTDDLDQLSRSARVPVMLGLTAAMIAVALARSRWRWLRWFRRASRPALDLGPWPTITGDGLDEDLSRLIAPPRGAKRGEMAYRMPFAPGHRLDHVRNQSLLRFLLGIPGIPEVDIRMPQGVTRLDIMLNLGESMRACRGRNGEPLKIQFAGAVAQLLAELYWQMGATSARLFGLGLRGDPPCYGPVSGRSCPGNLIRLAEEWAKQPSGLFVPPERLDVQSGTTVFWISDFLTDAVPSGTGPLPDLSQLIRWGSALADLDGRFAAIQISIPQEFEQIGLGYTRRPFALLDRLERTPADLRRAAGNRTQELLRLFARANLAFASVSSEHSVQTLLEELDGSGVLGPGY